MFLGILLFVAADKLLVVGVASTSRLIKTREYVFGLCIYYLGVDVNRMKIIITIWKLWWLVAVLFLHDAWDSCHTWQKWHRLIFWSIKMAGLWGVSHSRNLIHIKQHEISGLYNGWCWYTPQHKCVGLARPDTLVLWYVPTLTTPASNAMWSDLIITHYYLGPDSIHV